MYKSTMDTVAGALFSVLCFVVVVSIAMWVASISCHAQWERSGMEVSWGPIQGCMVGLPDGRWLPAERVREVDIPRKDAK